ncbi:CASP-like protein [Gossypium arboreum]|uniref:CASP-like protein n=1 Tax=Gossypium arboreum TaxID=29729 RepID=A0A0B0MYQ0_GOSAR|nr:CASP-like protein [Gossypium arboreum]
MKFRSRLEEKQSNRRIDPFGHFCNRGKFVSLLSYIVYFVLFSMFYSVTKLGRVGDHQSLHHTIKLLFWVPMILNILRI